MGLGLSQGDAPRAPPVWQKLILDPHILREPLADGQGVALWFAGQREGDFQNWERISSVPHAEFTVEPGIIATAATAVRARQTIRTAWGKFFQRFRGETKGHSWVLPNGETAEQCGERRSDVLLVWAEDEERTLDGTWINSHWSGCTEVRSIGPKAFVLWGVAPPDPGSAAEQTQAQNVPHQVAEHRLAAARQGNDKQREITALVDLGLALVHRGDSARAVNVLNDALAVARGSGDADAEVEVSGHMGFALVYSGQARQALPMLERRLAHARAAGDRFAEQYVLNHRGLAYAQLGDAGKSASSFEEALALARAVGYRKHEAELLWYLGIIHGEMGRREQAIAHAQAAIDLMQRMGNPQAAWYADHLRKYQSGETATGLATGDTTGSPAHWNGSITASYWASTSAGRSQAGGPGWLRMALTAAKSMAKFVGSGFKMVPAQTLQRRLRTCAACDHHTGLRCRLCGCFTNAKARMAHEECPIHKWTN